MKRIGAVGLLLAILVISGCAKKEIGSDKMEKFLPIVNGWQLIESPKVYTHDNLYDYIDGNCELYFSYGFKSLVSASYKNDKAPEQTVTVDIYDMGTSLSAFGVYSSQSHRDYSYQAIGCEAIVSPQQIRLWQDRFQVEINSSAENSEEILSQMARAVSQNLPACQPLAELNWLPPQDQIPHTLKYVAEGFLGQNVLPGGLEALYKIDDQEVRGFAAKCENAEAAKLGLQKYAEAQRGFQGAEVQDKGNHFESYHQYTGYVWAGFAGPWFYGAISSRSADDCRKIAEAIGKNLQAVKNSQ